MNENINLKDALEQRYKLRMAGGRGNERSTYVISLPKVAVEREARRLGVRMEDMTEKLIGVWKFGNFRGIYLCFEIVSEQ